MGGGGHTLGYVEGLRTKPGNVEGLRTKPGNVEGLRTKLGNVEGKVEVVRTNSASAI